MPGKKTNIGALPTKSVINDSDILIVQDRNATYNTTFGKVKEKMTNGLADSMVVENGKLYLTSEGKKISEGITIKGEPPEITWGEF